ncbi:tyrosine-type recombinase/integrase [Thermogemmatispora sp.]|uniref:tyrosine-type recombinase/integrase n=1 Tax=Thermogemmatispora sp. TaxID=1968838 RepID=UPI001DF129B1|nr:tyrosine-type recombinase/integrase [Thermogemmatispora sp.]MBX5448453.1 tyrosine-type recombinase/integrase [Thermogemmatispora sp.]
MSTKRPHSRHADRRTAALLLPVQPILTGVVRERAEETPAAAERSEGLGALAGEDLDLLRRIADIADLYAQHEVFARYHRRQAHNTRIRQLWDLKAFATFCLEAGARATGVSLQTDVATLTQALFLEASTWRFVSAGLIQLFLSWMERRGYAIDTMNVRLSTLKRYCRLAADAGVLSQEELYRISRVQGYRHKEGRQIDRQRPISRRGPKKAEPNMLTEEQVAWLKHCHDTSTPQGRRARVILCLLLDLGLRVGELVALQVKDVQLSRGLLRFYREKVDKEQTHRLSADCLQALHAYLPDVAGERYLFPGYKGRHISPRLVEYLLKDLGDQLGIDHLSPHDCRHYWATYHARRQRNLAQLQQAGGWNSPAMVLRYYVASEIANEGLLSPAEWES